ncbi:DUF2161 family putative PD-(D/E)XK-type phosphodiesterase [Psychromonas sp. 14N.309.X.WAT.B.A12]|uniref:DUF2161 family putative PD-(D/E)XK-type phosphodiesterase n=1 Tax=Psychromonas sp. 14N.309.X.WAT.B.A12 TaxID=2998322 RepID=UPI0025B27E02|nr:DUF2161 family putative PD-(D/E)XK-type phosphodiesterase [Psychromonas sp. 14N.309.X.WAT.B.A12]MDN2664742.1 DUF2161 family putative PD-(D/E)XK-type phosphodiesterase [Psychromonas sp. 14N.309.X.WAT.B.A12]
MPIKLQESDLYLPIKHFLSNLGYQVKGEVKNCDIVAIKDQEMLIIELKLTLNITLLLQAVERFTLADNVYIAIPKQATIYKNKQKQLKKLIARLGLGLIVVDIQKTQQYVEVINDPKDYTPKKNKRKQKALLKEFNLRQGDTQKGGSTNSAAGLTAYRQRAIRIAEYLLQSPPTSGASINKAIDEPQATQFLYNNHYAWFDKIQRGLYTLSEKGKLELIDWKKKQKISIN